MQALEVGQPQDAGTDIGPQSHSTQVCSVLALSELCDVKTGNFMLHCSGTEHRVKETVQRWCVHGIVTTPHKLKESEEGNSASSSSDLKILPAIWFSLTFACLPLPHHTKPHTIWLFSATVPKLVWLFPSPSPQSWFDQDVEWLPDLICWTSPLLISRYEIWLPTAHTTWQPLQLAMLMFLPDAGFHSWSSCLVSVLTNRTDAAVIWNGQHR